MILCYSFDAINILQMSMARVSHSMLHRFGSMSCIFRHLGVENGLYLSTCHKYSTDAKPTMGPSIVTSICPSVPISSSSSSNANSNTAKKVDTLICTILEACGNITSGRAVPITKSSLCLMYGLPPRDLRKLDGAFKNQIPVILVRQKSLLINLDYIKAIITSENVILFENCTDVSERLSVTNLLEELQEKLRNFQQSSKSTRTTVPFEWVILETILHRICFNMIELLEQLIPKIESSLSSLEQFVNWDKLRILMSCKRSIHSVQRQVDGLKRAITDILDNDQDMTDMYLSSKLPTQHPRYYPKKNSSDHEEVELLLESYLKMMEEVTGRMQELSRNMEASEDLVNIGLIGQRNELLLLQLKINICTFSAAISAMVAGWFGMNLFSGYESSPFAFYLTTGICASVSALAGSRCWKQMNRIVRT